MAKRIKIRSQIRQVFGGTRRSPFSGRRPARVIKTIPPASTKIRKRRKVGT